MIPASTYKWKVLGNFVFEAASSAMDEVGSAGEKSGKEALKQSESAVSKVKSRFK